MQEFQGASATTRRFAVLCRTGPRANFMDHSTPSDRQEGSPTEPEIKFTGSRDKAAKEGRNAKECNRYDTDRMLRLRKGTTSGVHGNKTSLNNGSAEPRVAQGKAAGSATGVQRTLHGRITRSQGLSEQTAPDAERHVCDSTAPSEQPRRSIRKEPRTPLRRTTLMQDG